MIVEDDLHEGFHHSLDVKIFYDLVAEEILSSNVLDVQGNANQQLQTLSYLALAEYIESDYESLEGFLENFNQGDEAILPTFFNHELMVNVSKLWIESIAGKATPTLHEAFVAAVLQALEVERIADCLIYTNHDELFSILILNLSLVECTAFFVLFFIHFEFAGSITSFTFTSQHQLIVLCVFAITGDLHLSLDCVIMRKWAVTVEGVEVVVTAEGVEAAVAAVEMLFKLTAG